VEKARGMYKYIDRALQMFIENGCSINIPVAHPTQAAV
jgi:hypothetical protein